MIPIFLSFQNIRYTMYFGCLLFFVRRRSGEIKRLALEQEPKRCDISFSPSNNTENYDWGQFVEIDCY